MNREFEASSTTMGGGIENMGTGSDVLYAISSPFLATNSEGLRGERHSRLEEGAKRRVRSAGPNVRLEEAICGLGQELQFDGAAQFRVFASGKQRGLSPELYEQIYCISREAVENAFRHSRATVVEAEVMYAGHALHVFVRDNGCGMDQHVIGVGNSSNRGLLEMRERAEILAGQLRIWSKVGAGTEIEVTVPLETAIAN